MAIKVKLIYSNLKHAMDQTLQAYERAPDMLDRVNTAPQL